MQKNLLQAYLSLEAFQEVPAFLKALRSAGIKTAILSNGNFTMLKAAVEAAGLTSLLDALLSVDDVKIFKPHKDAYALAVRWANMPAPQIAFFSSNSWDAWGGSHYGFTTIWVNRYNQKPEKLPRPPAHNVKDLRAAAKLMGFETV